MFHITSDPAFQPVRLHSRGFERKDGPRDSHLESRPRKSYDIVEGNDAFFTRSVVISPSRHIRHIQKDGPRDSNLESRPRKSYDPVADNDAFLTRSVVISPSRHIRHIRSHPVTSLLPFSSSFTSGIHPHQACNSDKSRLGEVADQSFFFMYGSYAYVDGGGRRCVSIITGFLGMAAT